MDSTDVGENESENDALVTPAVVEIVPVPPKPAGFRHFESL